MAVRFLNLLSKVCFDGRYQVDEFAESPLRRLLILCKIFDNLFNLPVGLNQFLIFTLELSSSQTPQDAVTLAKVGKLKIALAIFHYQNTKVDQSICFPLLGLFKDVLSNVHALNQISRRPKPLLHLIIVKNLFGQ